MRTDQRRLRRPGIAAAIVALASAGIIGGVGTAGAGETHKLFSVANGNVNPCFSETSKTTCDPAGERPTITIRTGDTVEWDMSSGGTHNAAPDKTAPATSDARWNDRPQFVYPATDSYTFGTAGTYAFVCTAHAQTMKGTIVVEGAPVTVTATATKTATPDATPTFAATVPPSATPVADDHLTTPAPGKGAKDTAAPKLLRAQVKPASGGAKLSFWVSEPANVEVTVRRGKAVVTTARLHVAAGARSVTLRSAGLRKRGTYTVEWHAVDAMANKSNVAKKTLKVKR